MAGSSASSVTLLCSVGIDYLLDYKCCSSYSCLGSILVELEAKACRPGFVVVGIVKNYRTIIRGAFSIFDESNRIWLDVHRINICLTLR